MPFAATEGTLETAYIAARNRPRALAHAGSSCRIVQLKPDLAHGEGRYIPETGSFRAGTGCMASERNRRVARHSRALLRRQLQRLDQHRKSARLDRPSAAGSHPASLGTESNMTKNNSLAGANERPLTLAERVQLGRETGAHANGAIVPFEQRDIGPEILHQLQGKNRSNVDRLRAAGFKVTVHPYRNEEGAILQLVLRFDHPNEPKEIRPLRYLGRDKNGLPLFWMSAIDAPRPLYGLAELAQRPDAPVLVVEGEKTAEAARSLFPEMVPVTWMSGAGSVARTELASLVGRTVTIWPDNDIAGRKAGRQFAALALKADAAGVSFVDIPREFGEKWDLADEVPEEHREAFPLRHLLKTARSLTAAEIATVDFEARNVAERHRLLGHKPGYSEVNKQAVADALAELDPSMSRLEWIAVGRSLFFAFAEDGLAMFDDWSREYAQAAPADRAGS